MKLGSFIASLRAGCRDLYLTSRLGDLPEHARRDVPRPDYCGRARWQDGKIWIGPAGNVRTATSGSAQRERLHSCTAIWPTISTWSFPEGSGSRWSRRATVLDC